MTVAWLWARLDDRLLHGQILAIWLPYLQPAAMACIPAAGTDETFLRNVYRSVLSPEINLWVGQTEQLVEAVESEAIDPQRTLLLIERLEDAVRLANRGLLGETLNLGCLAPSGQTRRLSRQVAISSNDAALLQELTNQGVRLIVQSVLTERPHVWPKDYV